MGNPTSPLTPEEAQHNAELLAKHNQLLQRMDYLQAQIDMQTTKRDELFAIYLLLKSVQLSPSGIFMDSAPSMSTKGTSAGYSLRGLLDDKKASEAWSKELQKH